MNWFENVGDKPTKIISELYDCSFSFRLGKTKQYTMTQWIADKENSTQVYAPNGCSWSAYDFASKIDEINVNHYEGIMFAGQTKHYKTSGGRSSEKKAPFFNVHYRGKGVIAAIGWSGQWNCDITRTEENVIIKSKIEDTEFCVYPGEKFRTSSAVVMPYQGSVNKSQNMWRRLLKQEFSLIGKSGRDEVVPFSAMVWGGMSTSEVLKRLDVIKELPVEYLWMDAGWYGTSQCECPDEFVGDWGAYTGDWRVNLKHHPNGLKDVSEATQEAGLKFLLWFETERVAKSAPILKEHPEYLLKIKVDDTFDAEYGNQTNEDSMLLNLGNEDAWNYCFEELCKIIEDLNIGCYRNDFNMSPLLYWRQNDTDDRRGITEIKYINGLYRLWDALLERFPNLMIDNCASGGRRIDIELMRRSVPLWRSDFQCPANCLPEGAQNQNVSYSEWIPYSGLGSSLIYDEYNIRSSYAGGLVLKHMYSENTELPDKERFDFLKKYSDEYLRIRSYFYADMYPLTQISDRDDIWSAVQFDRPENNDGIVQVFARGKAPYTDAIYYLENIDRSKTYCFEDLDGGKFTINGEKLISDGLHIHIEEKRKAKIFIYTLV